MKRFLAVLTAVVMLFAVVLTGCGQSKDASTDKTSKTSEKPLKIALLVNGTLGDKSFFDSANNGLKLIKNELGDAVDTKVVEMGTDQTKWQPGLEDASEQDYDIIIVGTWQMTEILQKVAPSYPDKKYIIFDTTVDYTKGDYKNVYSIQYKENESSFLAGALAAKITTSDTSKMKYANPQKLIGFLGGMDTPVINDFLVGYIQGAKYVTPDIKVAISYVGDFNDSAKGKEMALAQYNQGVDIGFNVAGSAGLGQLDAAKEKTKYAIGVDSDQALLFASDPTKANLIVTSALKNVDQSLLRAIKMYKAGTLKFGACETLGFKDDNAVGIADNEYYQKLVPEDYRTFVKDLSDKVSSGEIKVDSAFGMTTDQINTIRNSVKP